MKVDTSQTEVLSLIKQFLNERYQMTVATYGKFPWIATVYYSLDDDLKLYFLSDPDTIHCKQIAENSRVAVLIGDSPQLPTSNKKCVQISGLAKQVSGRHKIKHSLDLWRQAVGVTSSAYTYEGMMKKAIKGRMYQVTPQRIKFFNEELWEEGSEPEIVV